MAVTAPNMGLKVWNLLTDPYDHSQLASNWAKVDQHDHTSGKGVQIPTGGIADGAISGVKVGNAQITPEKLTASVVSSVGINTLSNTYRKSSANTETYSNSTTSYTVVDEASVTVQANGRLMVSYFALHKATTANASLACFVDGVEVKRVATAGAPVAFTSPALEPNTIWGYVYTNGGWNETSFFSRVQGVTTDTSLNTTGMTAPPSEAIFGLSAGTHKVEVKAKAGSSGKIEIKNRYLWVRAEGYE